MPAVAPEVLAWSEKTLDQHLFGAGEVAALCGWHLRYHTLRSKGSQAGFPDRVLVRERVLFAETKRQGEHPSAAQEAWLTGLARAGAEVYLWRPSDLDEIGQVLGHRWLFFVDGDRRYLVRQQGGAEFEPGSAWLPSGHRRDEP